MCLFLMKLTEPQKDLPRVLVLGVLHINEKLPLENQKQMDALICSHFSIIHIVMCPINIIFGELNSTTKNIERAAEVH